jgi:hypothetical protein
MEQEKKNKFIAGVKMRNVATYLQMYSVNICQDDSNVEEIKELAKKACYKFLKEIEET